MVRGRAVGPGVRDVRRLGKEMEIGWTSGVRRSAFARSGSVRIPDSNYTHLDALPSRHRSSHRPLLRLHQRTVATSNPDSGHSTPPSHHDRHAARRSRRCVRLPIGPDASHRYARGARRTVRLRFQLRAHHADFARHDHDGAVPARARSAPQRHAARSRRSDDRRRAASGGVCHSGIRCGLSARSALRPDQGLSDLQRSDAERSPGAARQRTCLATSSPTRRSRGSTSIVRAPSFSGSICSSRTHPMAIPRTIVRSASATTMKWRRRIVRWRDSSKRSGRNRRPP